MTSDTVAKGLEGIIAAETELSYVNGQEGILEYVGIPINQLAEQSSFEEVVFLLWNRRLPTTDEFEVFRQKIRAEYALTDHTTKLIAHIPASAGPMHALQTAVSYIGCVTPEPDVTSPEMLRRHGMNILAKLPSIVASFDRNRKDLPCVKPDPELSIAENFLYMINGERPTEAMAKALDVCLIIHADHGLNASTFTARCVASTMSDLFSAISAAVGSLKGPLHGGANERVMGLLREIGTVENAESFIREKMAKHEKIMGFGHRVYKTHDPRATFLKTLARDLAEQTGHRNLFEISNRVEEIMAELVASRGIYPNVDFYSATTYRSIGFEVDLFTPIFAVSRVGGWVGQVLEQMEDNRIMRPKANYIGPHAVDYVPIDQR